MRVFVTGATGFVGSAIVPELIRAGHQVTGLARSEAAAKALTAAGASAHLGHLEDLASLRAGVAAADGVIHAGFIHDFSKFKENCEIDRRAIEAMGSVLAGSQRPFVITSGVGILTTGGLATEDSMPSSPSPVPRVATEEAARAALARGVRISVVRLPPTVHGDGDHGFVPRLFTMAKEKGVSAYVGEGRNRWPAVHRLDAASVYRLALERAAAGGWYHAVAEEGVAFRHIAEAIGRQARLPVVSLTEEQSAKHFTWFAHFAAMDIPASSQQTREALRWQPSRPELIADIDRPGYFFG